MRRGARVEVITGCECAASCGQLSVLYEALDEEAGGHDGFGVGVVSLRSRFGGLRGGSFHSLVGHRVAQGLSLWPGAPGRGSGATAASARRRQDFCGALRRALGRVKRR